MKTAKTLFTLLFATTLVAGIGSFAAGTETAPAEVELAQPQPELPMCARCYLKVDDPSELVMAIDTAYEGEVLSAELITYDASSNASHFPLSSAVVDDLNDPTTNVTIVEIASTDAVSAELSFTHVAGSQVDVISVF